jgi:hypothetical protein
MQVGSTSGLSASLQSLEISAQNQYQANGDFSFAVDQAMAAQGTGGSSPSGGASKLSGSFQSSSVYAVGTFGADGHVNLFSQQQIQQELGELANARETSYGDTLQNFLTLAQAASPDGGPTQPASLTDTQQFTGDNGLIGGSFTTHLELS